MLKKLILRLCGLFGPRPTFELYPGAKSPTRGSEFSAGVDLYAAAPLELLPGETAIAYTGLKCKFLPGWVALIWDRSGMGARGIHRYAGVIDGDYRGFWGVVLHNSTNEPIVVNTGDRVAQVLFQRCWFGRVRIGTVANDTERGTGGFGSTGV